MPPADEPRKGHAAAACIDNNLSKLEAPSVPNHTDPRSLATMSKLPLVPIFSAAHVSKWDAIPEDVLMHATQSRLEHERTSRSCVEGQCDDADHCHTHTPLESSKLDRSVFSTRECEITLRVATSVGHAVAPVVPSKSRGTFFCLKRDQPTYTFLCSLP